MLSVEFPRDVIFTASLFGFATFVWAGWAQERPRHWAWRIVFGVLSLAGVALLGVTLPTAIRNWSSATALQVDSLPFTIYIVMVALEVVGGLIAAFFLLHRKKGELMAPVMLLIVGLHWVPMIWVFEQPFLAPASIWAVAVAIAAFFLPREKQAPSFWCGILAAPVFLLTGVIFAVVGLHEFANMPCAC
ncbi:hypothetical protein [Pseudoclavibacter helvolus]|uniref:hypothetical protein n=1 Tax=Pseudoclavibacter helvolus TaxID=255205 RepID=UPI003C782B05